MATYSTREVAKQVGIHVITLHRYILDGKVPAPKVQLAGGVKFRVWSEADIKRVKEILPKIANGRKTRHKKQSVKTKAQPRGAVPHKLRRTKKK
jgi:DNA-binding transcriptional MerR regulator